MRIDPVSDTTGVPQETQIHVEAPAPPRRARLETIDLLRGIAMALMALDHTRDFLSNAHGGPTDLATTTPVLFFTRWITHFCAPIFVLLAGMGVSIMIQRGRSRREAAKFLITRGFFLILLELTVIHVAWTLKMSLDIFPVQVIWALGWSMIVLAGLVFLPSRLVLAFGVLMIAGHNLLDGVTASGGAWAVVWGILHQPGFYTLWDNVQLQVIYPLVPWIGVMAAGYGLGELWTLDRPQRRKWWLGLGIGLTLAFFVLRWINGYGEPVPWSVQKDGVFTVLSFLNVTKYPPSLLYLLVTSGPAFLLLAFFDRELGSAVQPLITIGRVPLFFYLIHLPAIVMIQAAMSIARNAFLGKALLAGHMRRYDLWVVYLVWIGLLLLLNPICRWYAGLNARRREGWLRYL